MTLRLVLGWLVLAVSSAGTVDELPQTTTATGHHKPTIKGEHSIHQAIDSSPREITNRPNSTDSRVIVQEKCFLYMAESTVDGAGLGIFTVGPRQRGERIGWGGDPILPVKLNKIMRATGVTEESKHHAALMLRNYTWSARFGRGEDDATTEVLVLGIDSLMNSHLAASNAGPIALANDTYSQVVALSTIPAGGEVWSYYGDHWFRGREDFLDSMPGSKDYDVAEELIHTVFEKLMNDGPASSSMNADMWELMKEWKLVVGEGERIWNALPTTLQDAQKIASSGMSEFHQTTKTEKELNKDMTARCIDTIRVVDGQAVATQNLTDGAIITGSPVLHFMEGRRYLDTDVLEKCFGHTDSPVVLCPYAPGVTSMFPSKDDNETTSTPNVKVQWAPDGHMHHKESLLQESPESLLSYTTPVAALDFVALRDIAAGEDLVLKVDNHHHRSSMLVELWNKPLSLISMILRTPEEQLDNPYPGHIETQCHPSILSYEVGSSSSSEQQQGLDWINELPIPCEIEDRFIDPMTASITYSVRILDGPGIGGVPRRYIRFVDVKDVTPLSIIPDAWKTYQQPEMDEL